MVQNTKVAKDSVSKSMICNVADVLADIIVFIELQGYLQ